MNRRRLVLVAPALVAVVAAVIVGLLWPGGEPSGPTLGFSFEGDDGAIPVEPVIIRRRTITPEFNPPLALRGGRVIVARGDIACDPGETYRVEVFITQGGAHGQGRTAGVCTGEVQEWTATVSARGQARFSAGPAHACAFATTVSQRVTDAFSWCADPVLAPVGVRSA